MDSIIWIAFFPLCPYIHMFYSFWLLYSGLLFCYSQLHFKSADLLFFIFSLPPSSSLISLHTNPSIGLQLIFHSVLHSLTSVCLLFCRSVLLPPPPPTHPQPISPVIITSTSLPSRPKNVSVCHAKENAHWNKMHTCLVGQWPGKRRNSLKTTTHTHIHTHTCKILLIFQLSHGLVLFIIVQHGVHVLRTKPERLVFPSITTRRSFMPARECVPLIRIDFFSSNIFLLQWNNSQLLSRRVLLSLTSSFYT